MTEQAGCTFACDRARHHVFSNGVQSFAPCFDGQVVTPWPPCSTAESIKQGGRAEGRRGRAGLLGRRYTDDRRAPQHSGPGGGPLSGVKCYRPRFVTPCPHM